MDDFFGNTLANIIGTFVGAVLAIFSARQAERRQQRSADFNELQRVVDRLADARALTKFPKSSSPRTEPLAAHALEDEGRVRASVLTLRRMLGDAIHNISKNDPSIPHLGEMQGACSRYLNYVELHPRDYENAVQHLRDRLYAGIYAICRNDTILRIREPGSTATAVPQLGSY